MTDPEQSGGGPAAVARALVEAAFAGDFEAAVKYYTPDLEIRIEGLQTLHGHEGLRHIMDFSAEVTADIRVTIDHALGTGDTAAINRTTHMAIGGKELALEVGSFFELRDGLVCRWIDYQDLRIVSEALGH